MNPRISFFWILFVGYSVPCCLAQTSIGDRYPYRTFCVVSIADTPGFLQAACRSEAVKSLLQSPLPRLVTHLADKAENSPEFHGVVKLDDSESALLHRISELFDGNFELALVEHEGSFAMVAKTGVNPTDPLIEVVRELIANEDVLKYFDLKKASLTSGQEYVIHQPSGICFQFLDDQLSLYTEPSLIPEVAKWMRGELEKSLSDSRKFLLVSRRCKFSELGARDAFAYIDVSAILDHLLKQSSTPRESELLANEVSFKDLLAIGAVFEWNPDELVDFESRIHVAQAIPRKGINNILRLQSVEQPAIDDVPASVDVYLSANIDLEAVMKGVKSLDTFLESNHQRKGLASKALLNTLPLLGAFCYTIDPSDVKNCQGLIEHFGRFQDTTGGRAFSGVTRMRVGNTDASELMAAVIKDELAAGSLVRTRLFGLECATWSKAMEDYHLQQRARFKDLYPNLELPRLGRQIFFAADGQVGLVGDENLFEQVVLRNSDEFLIDHLEFQRCWTHAAKKEHPGAFIYMSPGTLFRPIVYLNRYMINSAFHENRLMLNKQERQDENSWQNTYHRRAIQSARSWNYSSLKTSLGPSAVLVFESPNGLDIRLIQFLKSKD